MANYIDGFVFPIARDRLNDYTDLASKIAEIWKEHGALGYHEFVGDDMELEGTASFKDVMTTTEDETIIFGWVIFDSKESRDLANKKVAADPRMHGLVELSNSGFDAKRMAYAGFRSLVSLPNINAN